MTSLVSQSPDAALARSRPVSAGRKSAAEPRVRSCSRALADLAGLSLRLKLGGDFLQKLRPQPLIDRPSQAEQHIHLVVVQLQRCWHGRAAPGATPTMNAKRAATSRGPGTAH